MRNFYSISKAQFITLLLFLLILEFFLLITIADSYESTTLLGLFAILIPFAGLFYSFGWFNAHSTSIKETTLYKYLHRQNWKRILGSLVIIIVLISIISSSIDDYQEKETARRNAELDKIFSSNNEKIENTRSYSLGSEPISTSLGIKISSAYYNLGSIVTSSYGYESYNPSVKTNGNYIDAQIKLENNQKFALNETLKGITLVDQEGRIYTPLIQTDGCDMQDVNYWSIDEVNRRLNPGIPCKVGLLFEVSKESSSFLLNFKAY